MTSEVTEWNLSLEVLRSQKEGCQRPNVAHGPLLWIDIGGALCVCVCACVHPGPCPWSPWTGKFARKKKRHGCLFTGGNKQSNIIFSTNLKKKNSADEPLTLTPI